jgi:hypothetical protein
LLDLNGVAFMKERRERGRCFGGLIEEAEKGRQGEIWKKTAGEKRVNSSVAEFLAMFVIFHCV